jgi:hypothetical protein
MCCGVIPKQAQSVYRWIHLIIYTAVKPYVVATDSALLKSKGKVWHKSSMKEGIVPCSGIDTDAMWGYSHTKEWIFGYKLHNGIKY